MDVFLTVMSYVGVIAFAVSGAMVAIRSEADLFGVVFLAVITSFGGGLTRDIILNRYPYPSLFEMKYEFICCIVTALIVFFLASFFRDAYLRRERLVENINNILDSIGISAFAVTGTQYSLEIMRLNRAPNMPFVAVVMGMISCIVGGLVRDVILGKLPWVLKKRIYALAALAGGGAFMLLNGWGVSLPISMLVGAALVFALRMCATVFHWDMPVAIRFSELDKPAHRLHFHKKEGSHREDDTVKR